MIITTKRNSLRGAVLTTRGFWVPALLINLLYGIVHAAGLRAYTAFLSGTSVGPNGETSAAFGITYLLLYFGWTVVSPILLLASFFFVAISNHKG